MSPNCTQFTVAFPSVPEPVVGVWRALAGFLRAQHCLPKRFEVSQIAGHSETYHDTQRLKLTPQEIEALILERSLDGFLVCAGRHETSVNYRLVHSKETGKHSYLWSIIDDKAKAPSDWAGLIEGLMTSWATIGGWQWKSLYRAWQEASVLDKHYERFGAIPLGISTHLEKGVPGIADRVRIDTSLNPGRSKQLLHDICFYPTAEMWLGPHFCNMRSALRMRRWLRTFSSRSVIRRTIFT
jgi:hypothetical protein